MHVQDSDFKWGKWDDPSDTAILGQSVIKPGQAP